MTKMFLQSRLFPDSLNGQFMYLNQIEDEVYERVDMENPKGEAAQYDKMMFFDGWSGDLTPFRLELVYD